MQGFWLVAPPVPAAMSLGQLLSLSSSGPGLPLITSDEFLAVDNDLIDVSGHNPLDLIFGSGDKNTAANNLWTISQHIIDWAPGLRGFDFFLNLRFF